MGAPILAGQTIVAGAGSGELSQYYGYSDNNSFTVTQATLTQLATAYIIAANEPQQGAAYKLSCGGYGTWGSTAQNLGLMFTLNGTSFFTSGSCDFYSGTFAASVGFTWKATVDFNCQDGVQNWFGTLDASVAANLSQWPHGNASGSPSSAVVVPVSSAITCLLEANWGSTTGAPTITTTWTKFQKEA